MKLIDFLLGLRPRPAALHRSGRSPARTCAGTFFEFLAYPSAFLLCCAPIISGAQPWPAKTVRIISPFVPGGPGDLLPRGIAASLGPMLGQQVIVENRPGGSQIIGMQLAAKSPPD